MPKVGITETAIRDGHQSLLATRMRTEDMIPALEAMDAIGYHSIECWGGATFDSCLRFLKEDPWWRLREIKSRLKHTPTQMLLRGQNAVGYRHYADDVVRAFCEKAVENGMDIFRIFDALNDTRNLETAFEAVKRPAATSRAPSVTRSARSTPSTSSRRWPTAWWRWAPIRSASRTWPACSAR